MSHVRFQLRHPARWSRSNDPHRASNQTIVPSVGQSYQDYLGAATFFGYSSPSRYARHEYSPTSMQSLAFLPSSSTPVTQISQVAGMLFQCVTYIVQRILLSYAPQLVVM